MSIMTDCTRHDTTINGVRLTIHLACPRHPGAPTQLYNGIRVDTGIPGLRVIVFDVNGRKVTRE